jgi:hypothetical protein
MAELEGRRSASTQNLTNDPGMFMKTKDKYKMSGSADRRFCGLRLFHDPLGRAAEEARLRLPPRYAF